MPAGKSSNKQLFFEKWLSLMVDVNNQFTNFVMVCRGRQHYYTYKAEEGELCWWISRYQQGNWVAHGAYVTRKQVLAKEAKEAKIAKASAPRAAKKAKWLLR